ncbi:8-oxoguanine DNA glycosylase OGG fold protein [Massilia oculi]|uniref:8-oxoguanine DNA glycosylase OGG fold protein n=1 Tax=Massilia oculi TaxID=945844 RepID=UPI001AAFEAC6|nr:hypothetical protein [Massilia oculi]
MAARSLTYPFQPAFRPEFIALLRSTAEPAPWEGLSAIDWARTFDAGLANVLAAAGYAELHARLTRQQLAAFCARDDVPIALRVAAVMAWGRANYRSTRNNKLLWASIPRIAALIERLPGMTRAQAFDDFQHLASSRILQGMRASFFTKLMFFMRCPGALILDQWLGKSVLALSEENWHAKAGGAPAFMRSRDHFIRLSPGGTGIHERMSGHDYERYCLALESLARPLGCLDAADTERWLFSEPRSEWRRLLKTLDWKASTVRAAIY